MASVLHLNNYDANNLVLAEITTSQNCSSCVANSNFCRSNHHSSNNVVNDVMQHVEGKNESYTFTTAAD